MELLGVDKASVPTKLISRGLDFGDLSSGALRAMVIAIQCEKVPTTDLYSEIMSGSMLVTPQFSYLRLLSMIHLKFKPNDISIGSFRDI